MLAIVAPGQGSQSPGFLTPWLADTALLDLLNSWSQSIGVDFVRLGTTADADEIRATENAQPLIVAAGMLGARALCSKICYWNVSYSWWRSRSYRGRT